MDSILYFCGKSNQIQNPNNMKKAFLLFVAVFLFSFPVSSIADKTVYVEQKKTSTPQKPRRDLEPELFSVLVGENSYQLQITSHTQLLGLHISVTQDETVYENDIMNVQSEQTIVYDLDDYAVGEYLLVLEHAGEILDEYIVTIEE